MEKVEIVKKYLGEVEYKSLIPLAQSVLLVQNKICSIRIAAKACNVGQGSTFRGLQASKKSREIGINGRPLLLSKSEEKDLFKKIDDRCEKHISTNFKEIHAMVFALIYSFK
jgi:hypothetical protein